MRSRAGSWSLAFVLVLSVMVIAGSSGSGFLALAQSEGTPAVEAPAKDEQPPAEVIPETIVPEPPTEAPLPPTETLIPLTQAPLPGESVADDSIVEAAEESGISLNITECAVSPAYWMVHLYLDQAVVSIESDVRLCQ